VLEKFDLSQALLSFGFAFVRSSEILSLFGKHLVPLFHFLDHDAPPQRSTAHNKNTTMVGPNAPRPESGDSLNCGMDNPEQIRKKRLNERNLPTALRNAWI
jgi:hypothetical protein